MIFSSRFLTLSCFCSCFLINNFKSLGIDSNIAQAQTESELLQQIEQYSQGNRQNNIEQVINVNQLRDVSPTDWSYEAIRSLSDCIATAVFLASPTGLIAATNLFYPIRVCSRFELMF